jgi:glucosyl-dolichyl phosphate glucuronosyltransferase
MSMTISIIVPTKDRGPAVESLLNSIKRLAALERLRPEIIIGDNGSQDDTWNILGAASQDFPIPITRLRVEKRGKSAVVNSAFRIARGKIVAFVDDDVTLDSSWLEAIERFFSQRAYQVGQGKILLPEADGADPEVNELNERYRTIPHLEFDETIERVHSLNGANFAVQREVLERVGCFDERLGPGASGTSEDVELAGRFARAGIEIGYMPEAVAYHRVDRTRLTEQYFKSIHKQQGKSRLFIKNRSLTHILFQLCRSASQYGIDSVLAKDRKRYRSKGRVYHYLGMLEAKWDGRAHR